MQRTVGRRSVFFAALALVSIALCFATPEEFRWVCVFSAGLAAFWSILLAAESLASPGMEPRATPRGGPQPHEADMPFQPPPPPKRP
jgi:hypothetical protein